MAIVHSLQVQAQGRRAMPHTYSQQANGRPCGAPAPLLPGQNDGFTDVNISQSTLVVAAAHASDRAGDKKARPHAGHLLVRRSASADAFPTTTPASIPPCLSGGPLVNLLCVFVYVVC